MNIITPTYDWNGTLNLRKSTKRIILHHRAGNGDVSSIHAQHIAQDWVGIGYHFYVRKDGSVYQGRPINTIGAHAGDNNSDSVGICFEGNFENEKMSEAQKKAGQELVSYVQKRYQNGLKIISHRDVNATACPGKNFPFAEIAKGVSQTTEKTKRKLPFTVKILDTDLNIRTGPGVLYKRIGSIRDNGVYTIVKTNDSETWGKLKSGAGWICIKEDFVKIRD